MRFRILKKRNEESERDNYEREEKSRQRERGREKRVKEASPVLRQSRCYLFTDDRMEGEND